MNKEPLALYVFRFALGLGLFAFMAMLYWSSVLLEDDLKETREDIAVLKNDLYEVLEETQEIRTEVLRTILEDQKNRQEILKAIYQNHADIENLGAMMDSGKVLDTYSKESELSIRLTNSDPLLRDRQHIDPSLPNLLEPDLFYKKTLPKMLGKSFRPNGKRQNATIGKPDHLHPFSNWSSVSSWIGMCNLTVASLEFGKFETMAPNAAIKLEKRTTNGSESIEFWVHLRDEMYWEPLNPEHFPDDIELSPHFLRQHQVTAHDFKFHFDAIMNTNVQEAGAASLRNYLGDIEEFRVIDDLTFVVRWKREPVIEGDQRVEKIKYSAKSLTGGLKPLPRFVYQYFPDGSKIIEGDQGAETYRTNSVWAQNFSQHWARNVIVSCGEWLFDGMSDEAIRFRRNPNHHQSYAVLVNELEVRFRESPDAIWQDFKAGSIDTYAIRSEQLVELENFLESDEYQEQVAKGLKIHRVDYVARSYNYLGWNQATPYFSDRKVRRAMTMAIDRNRIINQNLNRLGLPITGPFFQNSPSYDKRIKAIPYDLQASRQLLEESGWFDSDGDGVRDKEINGQKVPFRFGLTYYVKNPTSKANCEYVAVALKELGIDCQLNGVDLADLSSTWDEKAFDAIYLGWALGSPPEEPKQLWHSSGAKEKGSSNAIGFQNSEADDIISRLQYEYDEDKRLGLYHSFHRIIHHEAPYTFLYTPKSILLYRDYVKNVFIPAERQDLIPGANIAEPNSSVFWLDKANGESR